MMKRHDPEPPELVQKVAAQIPKLSYYEICAFFERAKRRGQIQIAKLYEAEIKARK